MLSRRLVVVGLVGLISFAANFATAEDAGAPKANFVALDGINFVDPSDAFADNRFEVQIDEPDAARFSNLGPARTGRDHDPDYRRAEVALTARSAGFDVSFAQRAGVGFNREGDIESRSRGSELRFSRARRDDAPTEPRWYLFAASEDEALTWGPSSRSSFGEPSRNVFSVQDQVEIGDVQAGVAYARDGWQASFAYVQREISVTTAARSFSQNEDFAGFTWTMRH
ncbi:MAG: hypothetical protein U1E03_03340 [Hyphomonadaceae bacterium]